MQKKKSAKLSKLNISNNWKLTSQSKMSQLNTCQQIAAPKNLLGNDNRDKDKSSFRETFHLHSVWSEPSAGSATVPSRSSLCLCLICRLSYDKRSRRETKSGNKISVSNKAYEGKGLNRMRVLIFIHSSEAWRAHWECAGSKTKQPKHEFFFTNHFPHSVSFAAWFLELENRKKL